MGRRYTAPGDRVTQQIAYVVARGLSIDRHELQRLFRGQDIEPFLRFLPLITLVLLTQVVFSRRVYRCASSRKLASGERIKHIVRVH